MKTYLIEGVYYGTQADAKAACKSAGIKFDPDFHTEEVPTDKDGLLAYVNRLSARAIASHTPSVDDLMAGDPISEDLTVRPTPAGLQRLAQGADADAIVEHIHAADHPALARITEASIFRMRELLKEAEGPSTDDLMG